MIALLTSGAVVHKEQILPRIAGLTAAIIAIQGVHAYATEAVEPSGSGFPVKAAASIEYVIEQDITLIGQLGRAAAAQLTGEASFTPDPVSLRTETEYALEARDPYMWPFARDSIWNMPIGSDADYVPAELSPTYEADGRITFDKEFISVDPSFPLQELNGKTEVHVDPTHEHDGSWNGCATLLRADDPYKVISGQPLRLDAGGDPSWKYTIGESIDLRADGIKGCHGGSRLSGIGGTIRKHEADSTEPIRHALKINLYCKRFCSIEDDGKRWPALAADAYADESTYGGPVPAVKMGTLLALPPDTDLSFMSSPNARRIAEALRDYGGYVVDDTAWDVHALSLEEGAEIVDGDDFHADLMQIFTALHAVNNNSPTAIGGGGEPRVPLAPCLENEAGC